MPEVADSDRRVAIYTHHKCGSSWLHWVIGTVLHHNRMECFTSLYADAIPAVNHRVSVLSNANYFVLKDHLCSENIHFVRNPLSVLSSAYHSHLRTHSTDGWERLKNQRQLLQTRGRDEGILLPWLSWNRLNSTHERLVHFPGC
jgi:hypothetical protein